MYQALNPVLGAPGSFEQYEFFSVKTGFGGPAAHPQDKATIADIASFHNEGAPPHLPQRKIIVLPTPELLNLMSKDAVKNLGKDAYDATK
jgi:hypothetical protein